MPQGSFSADYTPKPLERLDVDDSGFILNTPFTWALIEEDLQKALSTDSKLGSRTKASKCGEGAGFVSDVILLTLDWQPSQNELPEHLILKMTTADSVAGISKTIKTGSENDDLLEKAAQIHNNELNIYSKAATKWKFPQEMKLTKFYCGRELDKTHLKAGYLIIGYIPKVVFIQYCTALSVPAVIRLARQIAHLAVHSYRNPHIVDELTSSTGSKVEAYLDAAYSVSRVIENLDYVAENFRQLGPIVKKLKRLAVISGDFKRLKAECLKHCPRPAICHFDFHIGNVIWTHNEDEDLEITAIIDWQTCHANNPLIDLVRITSTTLEGGNFFHHAHLILPAYYEVVASGLDANSLWDTYENFVKCFECVYPYVVTRIAPLLALKSFQERIVAPLESYERSRGISVCIDKMQHGLICSAYYAKKWKLYDLI